MWMAGRSWIWLTKRSLMWMAGCSWACFTRFSKIRITGRLYGSSLIIMDSEHKPPVLFLFIHECYYPHRALLPHVREGRTERLTL